MRCPKCGFEQDDSLEECMRCGIVFKKYEEVMRKRKQNLTATYSPVSTGIKRDKIEISKEDIEFLKKFQEDMKKLGESVIEEKIVINTLRESVKNQRMALLNLSNKVDGYFIDLSELREDLKREMNTLKEDISNSQLIAIEKLEESIRSLNEKLRSISLIDTSPYVKKIEEIYSEYQRLKTDSLGEMDETNVDIKSMEEEIKILQAEVKNLIENRSGNYETSKIEDEIDEIEIKLKDKIVEIEEKLMKLDEKIDSFREGEREYFKNSEGKSVVEDFFDTESDFFKIKREEFEIFKRELQNLKGDVDKLKKIFKEFSRSIMKLEEKDED